MVVVIAAGMVTFCWLGALSVRQGLDRSSSRSAAREPVYQEIESDPGPRVRDRFDAIGERQFTVRWIAPESGDPAPPGVDLQELEQRRFLVSPALESELRAHGSARYQGAGRIAPGGLAGPQELLAYGYLSPGAAADGWPVARFGGAADRAEVERFPYLVAVLVFVIGPGVFFLSVALGIRSDSYTYRCQLLARLGVPRRRIASIGSIEAAGLAALGACLGATAHTAWSRAARSVPVVGRKVFEGDLEVGLAAVAATGLAVMCSAAIIGSFIATRRSRGIATNRPSTTTWHQASWRLAPMGVSFAALLAAMATGAAQTQIRWMLAAGLLVIAGLPLALPVVAGAVGRAMAEGPGLTTWMAGRRMERDPRSAMRPLLALSAALTIGLSVIGYIAAVRYDDPPAEPGRVQAATVRYAANAEAGPALDALPGDLILVPFDEATWLIDSTCSEIAAALRETGQMCDASGQLTAYGRSLIGQQLSPDHNVQAALRLGAVAPDPDRAPMLIALGPARRDFAEAVRRTVEPLDAPEVYERVEASVAAESVLVRWLLGGFAIAASTAVCALCLLTLERFGRSIGDHQVLIALGIPRSVHWRIETLQFATCATVSAAIASAAGTTFAVVMTRAAQVPIPGRALLAATLATFLGLIVLTAAVAVIARVRLHGDPIAQRDGGQARWIM